MASSIIHLCIAKEVVKELNVNEEEFLYGNILPDYLAIKNYRKKDKLHFYEKQTIGDITKENVNLEKFIRQYGKEIKDSVSLGIYSHFITDYIWIENFMINHLVNINNKNYLRTKRGNIRNNRITVYKEYDKMNKWLINKYNVSAEFIKNINYNGIFKEIYDLPTEEIFNKTNQYMNQFKDGEMEIFTKEEIENFIQMTSKEVVKRLKAKIKE